MILGIDIGANGAAVLMDDAGIINDICQFKNSTPHDIAETIMEWHSGFAYPAGELPLKAIVENVHSSPAMGVCSAFSFGQSKGFLLGVLTALKIPYEEVTPARWQKELSCLSKGDKNVTKAKAQTLFPNRKITHATADAILIAEYGRRTRQ